VDLPDCFDQLLTQRVALTPAFERGDAVGGANGLPVVPFEPVAQNEPIDQLVVAGGPAIDHLRLRLEILVERKERVEDQIPEIAGHIGRRPDRVDAAQISLRDEAQGLRPRLATPRSRGESQSERYRGSRRPEYAGASCHRFPSNLGCRRPYAIRVHTAKAAP
jgi:hypothetical protein